MKAALHDLLWPISPDGAPASSQLLRWASGFAAMPRFHIHVHNHIGETRDEEGADYSNLEAASRAAIQGVREILGEEIANGALDLRGRIEITGEDGSPLRVIPFDQGVTLQREAPQ